MKKLFSIFSLIPLLFASCNNEGVSIYDKTVEVSFTAELPQEILTRASSELSVNTVVCAVFEDGSEIEALRESKPITDPSAIEFGLPLVKGRSYNVVFWAMKDANYNVSNLKAISRSATGSTNEADYDAFTAVTSVTVQNAVSRPVTLTRPLAQLNIGITENDWNTVSAIFGQTPAQTSITYRANDTFNALAGEVVSGYSEITRTAVSTGSTLTVEGTEYKHLGTFYVLMAEDEKTTLYLSYSVTDTDGHLIREDVIPSVPMQKNFKTNLVGGLLTGTVTYQITIGNGFSSDEKNEVIQ